MRFLVFVWIQEGLGDVRFIQSGASAAMDAGLLGKIRDAFESPARGVFLVDTVANTITRLR